MEKQMIREKLKYYFSMCDLDGESFDRIRERFTEIEKIFPDHQNIRLEMQYYGDGDMSINVMGDRLETDEELDKRLKKIEMDKENALKSQLNAEIQERKLYERLKEKYEGK
jgi:DNA polymerase III delta prime subunit